MVLFYFLSHRVIRSVQYGEKPRNRLDMYVPRNHWRMQKGLRPVVIYVTGRLPGMLPEGHAGIHMVDKCYRWGSSLTPLQWLWSAETQQPRTQAQAQ